MRVVDASPGQRELTTWGITFSLFFSLPHMCFLVLQGQKWHSTTLAMGPAILAWGHPCQATTSLWDGSIYGLLVTPGCPWQRTKGCWETLADFGRLTAVVTF